MPEVHAFRGVRYDLGHVGSLTNVVAPPYDVIDAALQDRLYKLHPANVIRLELTREEPGDTGPNDRYNRAARHFRNWQSERVLVTDGEPALYVYHQVFEHEGRQIIRRGFMGRVRLERFGEGKIYPHEETLAGPKADRLMLTRACRANLSQIFGLYPDEPGEAQGILEQDIADKIPLEATDHLGVVHRMWPVTDVNVLSRVGGLLGPKPVFIADGHHRYETACNYRDEVAAAGNLPANHPANFVLMMCVAMSDPGLIVMPTHRLFRGLPAMDSDALKTKLGDAFACRVAGEGVDLADSVWEQIETEGEQGTIGLYTAADQRWTLARISEPGRRRMGEVASDHGPEWQGLGVAILHRLLIETLLEGRDLPKPKFVHLVSEVSEGLEAGEFPLAALVMPATVDHIRQVSLRKERMPAKSTYFYPKLLSGLVFNPLE